MQIDESFLLQLLLQLKAAPQTWHSIEVLDEALLLDEEKLLFHLELLFDRQHLVYRPAGLADEHALLHPFSQGDCVLRMTSQGHQFTDALLLQARQKANWAAFMQQRHKKQPWVDPHAERSLYGMDDIDVVFRMDDE